MAIMEEKNEEGGGGGRRKAQETREEDRRKNKEIGEGEGGGGGRGEAQITRMNENERKKGEEEGGGGGGGEGGGEDITGTKERRRGRDKNTQIGGGRGRGGGGRPGRLGRIWLLTLLILTLTLRTLAKHDTNTYNMDEDDDLSLALNLLYRESDDAIDPHDMLPGSRDKVNARPVSGGGQGSAAGSSGEGEAQRWVEECQGEERVAEELERCQEHLDTLRNSLEKEQIASLKLQKVLAKEGILDLQAFYRRAVQHLWNTLKLEEGQELLKDGNTAVMRQVLVRVSKDHITGLANYLETESDPHKVDEFFQQGFTLQDLDSDASPSLLHSLVTLVTSLVQAGKSLEVWLVILCVGFVTLGLWAVVLFVQDIQRQLRWGRVLGMMATVMFFISCLWDWRHMYKMAESRRHAQLAKKGYTGIPEECQPGAKASVAASVYEWIRVRIFGSPDVCEQYFEELMIDSMEEITPGMVIAETLSRFIFQPLQHLGTESAKLTTNFYQTVPLPYHFHATFLFLGLLIVLLFFGCAYGVDFPLGLGGFSPKSRPEARSANAIDKDGLGQEAVEQLKKDREKFLEESRRMLSEISREAVSWQSRHQPVVVASSSILEAQLEQLISRQLTRAMDQSHAAVRTISSTPLRSEGCPAPVAQGAQEELPSPGTLANLSSSSEGSTDDGGASPAAVQVFTDAVHHRMANRTRVAVLPPRTSRSSSRSSSVTSSPGPSEASTPSGCRKRPEKHLKKHHSADSPPRSPPPSLSTSTQSLGAAGLDEPDLRPHPDSGSFVATLRNILDLSANSGTLSGDEELSQAQT